MNPHTSNPNDLQNSFPESSFPQLSKCLVRQVWLPGSYLRLEVDLKSGSSGDRKREATAKCGPHGVFWRMTSVNNEDEQPKRNFVDLLNGLKNAVLYICRGVTMLPPSVVMFTVLFDIYVLERSNIFLEQNLDFMQIVDLFSWKLKQ